MKKQMSLGRLGATLVLAAAVVATPLALGGCSGSGDDASSEPAESQQAEDQAQDQAEASQSDYSVTIDGATTTTDYEGNPAVIVSYTFTNNSDEATSFAVACHAKVFQNGVQLESAIVTDDLGNGYMAEIKPGASTQASIAYSLTDTSDITVEVEELFSLDDALLAEATFSVA